MRTLLILVILGWFGYSATLYATDSSTAQQEEHKQKEQSDDLTCKGVCCTDEGLYNKDCIETDPEDLAVDYMLGDPNVPDF